MTRAEALEDLAASLDKALGWALESATRNAGTPIGNNAQSRVERIAQAILLCESLQAACDDLPGDAPYMLVSPLDPPLTTT
jgi:hypothetical protein